ncbi:MAG: aminotransferase class I/II-fold pyridoxal phosphate-dependent enzyme [Phycisphaerales bacterium]|nr:aminotransferase class I/II-fold pyridoxal phosphate-dependent enzyme [Phycisphaerales bacterium]
MNPSRVTSRLRPFGESIFTTMSRLAVQHRAVNLGQGFPDFDGPAFAKDAAKAAIDAGFGQYARAFGLPDTNAAISRFAARSLGWSPDPDAEVTVTAGCTEAIAAVLLGLLEPGDEVILLDPCYDSYPACVAMAGAVARRVRLESPEFRIDADALRHACSARTRAILVNSPHNPTGRMLDAAERQAISDVALERNLIVLSDEVYEMITYAGPHRSIATLPGMRERTIVMSSLGKTLSLTGWKIGWTVAPPELTAAVRASHQFLTFCAATPLQKAAATALDALATDDGYLGQLAHEYARRRELLLGELTRAGFRCIAPEGSYFILADVTDRGFDDDVTACRAMVAEAGVAAIPASAFYDPSHADRRYARFAFCKRDETIQAAGERLAGWRPPC